MSDIQSIVTWPEGYQGRAEWPAELFLQGKAVEASAPGTLARERRSIHSEKKKPVSQESIAEIIVVTKSAPSSMNTQPWFFPVVTYTGIESSIAIQIQKTDSGSQSSKREAIRVYSGKSRLSRQKYPIF